MNSEEPKRKKTFTKQMSFMYVDKTAFVVSWIKVKTFHLKKIKFMSHVRMCVCVRVRVCVCVRVRVCVCVMILCSDNINLPLG